MEKLSNNHFNKNISELGDNIYIFFSQGAHSWSGKGH